MLNILPHVGLIKVDIKSHCSSTSCKLNLTKQFSIFSCYRQKCCSLRQNNKSNSIKFDNGLGFNPSLLLIACLSFCISAERHLTVGETHQQM